MGMSSTGTRYAPKASRVVKRAEKPLLHKILNRPSFKTQNKASPKAKDVKIVSGKEEVVMEDIDVQKGVGSPPSSKPVNPKSPLCPTDPNVQLGMALNPKVREND